MKIGEERLEVILLKNPVVIFCVITAWVRACADFHCRVS